jgi:hypothetical protein
MRCKQALPKVGDPFEALSVGGLHGNGFGREVAGLYSDVAGPTRPCVTGNYKRRFKLAAVNRSGATDHFIVLQADGLGRHHLGYLVHWKCSMRHLLARLGRMVGVDRPLASCSACATAVWWHWNTLPGQAFELDVGAV